MAAKAEADDLIDDAAASYLPFAATPGEEIGGVVTAGPDWCDFFLRPDSCDMVLLEETNDALNTFYDVNDMPSLKALDLWRDGMPCAVRYVKDGKWYRGRLEDMYYNLVRFVDYGNHQMCGEEDLKPLLRNYADIIAPCTIRCTLTGAQDASLPSFVSENAKVTVTILGVTEPYEVAVQILPANTGVTSKTNGRVEPPNGAASASRFPTARANSPRPCTATGLTLLPQRKGANFDDDFDGDLKPAKAPVNNRRAFSRMPYSQGQQSKYNIQNGTGTFCDLYATCGYISLVNRPASKSEVNVQQSSFCGGPLQVDDMRRLFRLGERVRYNAKYEQPYVTQEMEWVQIVADDNDPEYKKTKTAEPPVERGRWLVTDFKLYNSDHLLVTHAVVNFIGDTAASLHVRGTDEAIWAPKSIFPERVANSDRSLRDLVDIGRSVIVRAEPTDKIVDFKLNAQWIAKAVELVGPTYEEKGTMYVVRDNYSVIITEGNVGFGYVFVANQFVDSAGVRLEEWYGTRVYFRSCADVPDKDDFRYGIRMKALRAHLSPEETKGPYRYAGIYRPPSINSFDEPAQSSEKPKKWASSEDDALDLPSDAIKEIDLLGVDTIGIEQPVTFDAPESIARVVENLQNDIRYEAVLGNGPVDAAASNSPTDAAMASASAALKNPVDQEDTELMSTVEIIFEPYTVPLFLPSRTEPVATATLTNGTMETLTNETERVVNGEIESPDEPVYASVACQTTVTQNEERELEELALVELRTAVNSEAELSLLMEFSLNLRDEERQRFYKIWKRAMLGNAEGM